MREVLDSVHVQRAAVTMRVHVLLEILLAELVDVSDALAAQYSSRAHLEDEDELGLGVDDIVQSDNVDVLELCDRSASC